MGQASWQPGKVIQHVNHGEVTTVGRLFFSLLVIIFIFVSVQR